MRSGTLTARGTHSVSYVISRAVWLENSQGAALLVHSNSHTRWPKQLLGTSICAGVQGQPLTWWGVAALSRKLAGAVAWNSSAGIRPICLSENLDLPHVWSTVN